MRGKRFRASSSRKVATIAKREIKGEREGREGNTGIPSYKGVPSSDVTVAAEIHRVRKNNPRTLKKTTITNKQTKNNYVHKYTAKMAQVSAFYLFSS